MNRSLDRRGFGFLRPVARKFRETGALSRRRMASRRTGLTRLGDPPSIGRDVCNWAHRRRGGGAVILIRRLKIRVGLGVMRLMDGCAKEGLGIRRQSAPDRKRLYQ